MTEIPLSSIDTGENVRDVADAGLAASIAEHGVLTPVIVAKAEADRYRLVVGHRRLAGARAAGLPAIPAVVVDPPADPAILQLVENIQRSDLAPMERARAIQRLVDSGMSQADVARALGLDPSTIANDLRLLRADPSVHEALAYGRITRSHAKAIASRPRAVQQSLVRETVAKGWSSHDLEQQAASLSRSVVVPLRDGARATVGVTSEHFLVDLVVEDRTGRGVMVELTAPQAELLGRRFLQAAKAVRS